VEDLGTQLFYERLIDEERQRLDRYAKFWDYYNGKHKKPLKVKPGEADDNVIVNLSKLIVDKGVSFLFGKDVQFELEEGATTPAEQWLADCWRRNRKMSFLQEVALNGAVCGHFFIKIIPDGLGRGVPRLINLDPAYVRPVWDADDYRKVLWYKIEYTAYNPNGPSPIHKKQMISRMEDLNGVTRAWRLEWYEAVRGRKYELVRADIWPHPWPPIVDGQNLPAPNEFFGKSDLEDADLNDAINFAASNILRILRFHAHPKTVGRGLRASDIDIAPNEMICLPSPDSDVFNLEMQSDLSSSRQFWLDLMDIYREVTRTPHINPGRVNVGALSGFALRILYGPLLEKTETKRRLYGDALIELNRRLLDLGGFGPDHWVRIHWPDPIPFDPKQETEALKADRELGIVSRETLASRRGYDWAVESERLEAEATEEVARLAKVMGGAE